MFIYSLVSNHANYCTAFMNIDDVLNSIDLVLRGCDQRQEHVHYPLAGGTWYHFPRYCRGVSKGPVKFAPI